MTLQDTIQPFLEQLASATPTPGGGSAAAAAGAMGAALVSMMCNLTIGREKFAGVETSMQDTLARSEVLRAELTQLIDDDAAAFNAVLAAFRLPKTTDKEKAARRAAIQTATQKATLTPLATARACSGVIQLGQKAADMGNPNAISDTGAGVILAQAGLNAAALNVLINLPTITDQTFVANCRAELDQILTQQSLADEVYESIKSTLN